MSASARHELLQLIRHQQVMGKKGAILLAHVEIPSHLRGNATIAALHARLMAPPGAPAGSVVHLAPAVIAIAATDREATRIQRELGKIGEFLEHRRLGKLRCEAFDLPNDVHRVFAVAGRIVGDAPAQMALPAEVMATRSRNFDSLMALELMLRSADISNLVRERPVFDFSDPNNPVVVATELVVDIAEIGRLAKANVHRHPWLLDEVTRLLDYRMLAHLLREPGHCQPATSVNLHIETVLSDDFVSFLEKVNTNPPTLPSIELNLTELKAFPELATEAVARLKEAGSKVIVDGITTNDLIKPTEKLPTIAGGYKFDWRNSLALDAANFDAPAAAAAIAPELHRLGVANCVLLHCHTPTVIERGLAIGFTLLEGFEVDHYAPLRSAQMEEA